MRWFAAQIWMTDSKRQKPGTIFRYCCCCSSFQNRRSLSYHSSTTAFEHMSHCVMRSLQIRRLTVDFLPHRKIQSMYIQIQYDVYCRCQFTGFKNSDNIFRSLVHFSRSFVRCRVYMLRDERQPIFAVIIIMNASHNRFVDFLDTLASVAIYLRK